VWDSMEHDTAYRTFRASQGASDLGPMLAAPPVLTYYSITPI